jgi:hypothetical protein
MLKDLFHNRLFLGAFVFFIFCVGGSLLYMQHVEKQSSRELAETQERIKALRETPPPTAEVSAVGDTSQGGHVHADGTWHDQPHDPPVRSTTAQLREPQPVDTSRAPMNASKGAGNPHPFQNVPVDLYDFEATKATMIENINFVKENWDPKTFFDKDLGREMRIANAITANISNATMLGIYTREQARELRGLRSSLVDFQGHKPGRVSELQEQGHTLKEAIRIAAEETAQRQGVE